MALDDDAIISAHKLKPHFLFTGTKYLLCDPKLAENALATFTYNSLRDSGYGSFDFLAIDGYVRDERPYDHDLLELCRQRRPDIYALVWWPLGHQYRNPSFETLYTIREQYKIPIVAFWYDTWDEKFVKDAERLSRQVDLSVISDSLEHFENSPQLQRFINLVPPFDQNVFQDPDMPRDIPISFNGAIGAYADRKDGLEFLTSHGIPVVKTGGQMEERLSLADYAQVFMRSKISLNWTRSGEKLTLKGRAFEATLCGSMLLESECVETTKYFKPFRDYVPFSSNEDLLVKLQYYLSHEDERIAIAQNGKARAEQIVDGLAYWEKIYRQTLEKSCWDSDEAIGSLLNDLVSRGDFHRAYDHLLKLFTRYQQAVPPSFASGAEAQGGTELLASAFAQKKLLPGFISVIPTDQECAWMSEESGTLIVKAQVAASEQIPPEAGCVQVPMLSIHSAEAENSINLVVDLNKLSIQVQLVKDGVLTETLCSITRSLASNKLQIIYVRYSPERITLAVNGVLCATVEKPRIGRGFKYLKIHPQEGEHPQREVRLESLSYAPQAIFNLEQYLRCCLLAP